MVSIDQTTRKEGRLLGARFCVNMDILKELDQKIYLDIDGGESWEQEIVYENLPIRCDTYESFEHYTRVSE